MKKITILFMTLAFILSLSACATTQSEEQSAESSQGPTWQEQYDLGVRYLSEGNYQEAIIAFTAAIEIDPKQASAYVGRGDAYVLSGETEENLAAALADYERSLELNPNPEIEEKIQRIRNALTEIVADENGRYKISDFFEGPEISTPPTIGGITLQQQTFSDLVQYYAPIVSVWDDEYALTRRAGNVMISQMTFGNHLYIHYTNDIIDSEPIYQPEYLGIHLGDSFDHVLQTLGITDVGAQYLKNLNTNLLDISVYILDFDIDSSLTIDAETWCSTINISCNCELKSGIGFWSINMFFDEDNRLDSFNASITGL